MLQDQELVSPRPNRIDKIENGPQVGRIELRLVRALVGNLVQQNGELKNSRLIICLTKARKRPLVSVCEILEKKIMCMHTNTPN